MFGTICPGKLRQFSDNLLFDAKDGRIAAMTSATRNAFLLKMKKASPFQLESIFRNMLARYSVLFSFCMLFYQVQVSLALLADS